MRQDPRRSALPAVSFFLQRASIHNDKFCNGRESSRRKSAACLLIVRSRSDRLAFARVRKATCRMPRTRRSPARAQRRAPRAVQGSRRHSFASRRQ